MIKINKNNTLARTFGLLLLLTGGQFLTGCSSSSSSAPVVPPPPPPVDQNPSGLYKDGTGTFNSIAIADLRAIVHDNRIIIFSETTNFLIDGTINTVTLNDYTATVDVYSDGVINQQDVAVTGMVTNGSMISGTLSGTSLGSGNFSLVYDVTYERGATFARVETDTAPSWTSSSILMFAPNREINNYDVGSLSMAYDFVSDIGFSTERCGHNGTVVIPDSAINIYQLTETIVDTDPECTVSLTGYTGFAAVIDGTATDNTLLHVVTNGTNSEYAVLTR